MKTLVLDPGDVVGGRYRVERRLGEGGMGAVYLATHLGTTDECALKVLTHGSEDALRNFQFEATVAARVRRSAGHCPHIVNVIDADHDKEKDCRFIAMELLQGASLEDHVKQRGALPVEEVVTCVEHIAIGLDAAHSHREEGKAKPILHRDLKPANLFLADQPAGPPIVKILDFGLAKLTSHSIAHSTTMRGTPLYMAPEQIEAGPLSPQTDIWALGLITFFLLAGREYWKTARAEGASIAALQYEVLYEPPERASERFRRLVGTGPAWPRQFDDWFARAANRIPHHRFRTAGEAATLLRAAFLEQVRIPASGAMRGRPLDETEPSPPSRDAPARGAVSSEPAAAVGASHPALSSSQALVSSGGSWRWLGAAAVGTALLGGGAVFLLRGAPASGSAAAADTEDAPTASDEAATAKRAAVDRVAPPSVEPDRDPEIEPAPLGSAAVLPSAAPRSKPPAKHAARVVTSEKTTQRPAAPPVMSVAAPAPPGSVLRGEQPPAMVPGSRGSTFDSRNPYEQ